MRSAGPSLCREQIRAIRISAFVLLSFLYCLTVKGESYFQQDVSYTLHASLDDVHHFLSCREELVYENRSPDTLRQLYFHLWPNAYANDHTALARELDGDGSKRFHPLTEEKRGFIDSLDFYVDGAKATWH